MEDSNLVLADYQKAIGVADLDDNKNTLAEQLGELSRQLSQAQSDRIQMQALLENVKRGSPDSLPEVRNNPVVQQMSAKLADVKTQLSQAMVVYGTNHPTVKKLQSQANRTGIATERAEDRHSEFDQQPATRRPTPGNNS